jgi:prophage regulatory protein
LRVLPRRAVAERVNLSSTTIWRLVRRRQFPAPIKLSSNRVGWVEGEIDAWVAERTAASRSAA